MVVFEVMWLHLQLCGRILKGIDEGVMFIFNNNINNNILRGPLSL